MFWPACLSISVDGIAIAIPEAGPQVALARYPARSSVVATCRVYVPPWYELQGTTSTLGMSVEGGIRLEDF
jgi:hypothetical protein